MKIVIPARARINSQSDVSRAIFRQTSISVHSSRHVHTNESRPGPGWSVSNRTRELRNPCDRIFRRRRSRSIHDLAYGYRHTFRQITCSPRLLIPSFSLSGKIIDPPFSTNCPFLVFQCSTNLLNVSDPNRFSRLRFTFDQASTNWRNSSKVSKIIVQPIPQKCNDRIERRVGEATGYRSRSGEFSSRKRWAGTVTDSRLAEKYGARAKFCARFTRPD